MTHTVREDGNRSSRAAMSYGVERVIPSDPCRVPGTLYSGIALPLSGLMRERSVTNRRQVGLERQIADTG
jgi:hypothetical protein